MQQPLTDVAEQFRLLFTVNMNERLTNREIYMNNFFSEEAYFYNDGYVNKQNWRIWGFESPNLAIKRNDASPYIKIVVDFIEEYFLEKVIALYYKKIDGTWLDVLFIGFKPMCFIYVGICER
ncbi:hypothetical protein RF11_15397 [Thelohanellus kitauei]|uniref:Uncharacterized protein n=1 Tax=Thelohanellus kitauei TaxID=669202 RepID=A0A0C2JSC0_THEKT|nr:hypothetical protein RF11_15397 [Thelohanellus kitauei]